MVLGAEEIKKILLATQSPQQPRPRSPQLALRKTHSSKKSHPKAFKSTPQNEIVYFLGVGSRGLEKGLSKSQLLLTLAPAPAWTLLPGASASPEAATESDGKRLPAGPGPRARPPLLAPPLSSNPRLPARRRPPLGALPRHAASSPAALYGPDPVGNLPTRSGPAQPGILLSAQRGPPGISAQCQSSAGTRRRDCAPLANQARRTARPGASH